MYQMKLLSQAVPNSWISYTEKARTDIKISARNLKRLEKKDDHNSVIAQMLSTEGDTK